MAVKDLFALLWSTGECWRESSFERDGCAASDAVERPTGGKGSRMQFVLGVIFFVVVVGILDAGVPWPRCGAAERKQ